MPKGNQDGSIEVHNGKLRVVYYVDGRRVREGTGQPPTKEGRKAAAAFLRRRLAEIETGQFVEPARTAAASRLFREYADTWIDSLALSKTRGGAPYKPRSIERYRRLMRAWCKELGDKQMSSLTKTDLVAARAKVLVGMSQNHSSNLVVILKKMLRQAEIDRLVSGLTLEMKSPLPEKRRLVDGDVWSKDEAAGIPAIAAAIDPNFGAFTAIGLRTGMRCGELRALRLENIDLAGRVIRVRLTTSEDYEDGEVVGPTKTMLSIRDLDIDPALVEILRAQVQRVLGKSEWLFPCHIDPKVPLRYWKMLDWFEALGKKMGRYLSPHRLRHTFASTALTAGQPLSDVASYMGDTQATVERVYYTWADKAARRAAAARFASMYDVAPMSPQAEEASR